MKDYLKFLRRLPKGLRGRIISAILKISEGKLKNLDVKNLKGTDSIYRCRMGKIRIIFEQQQETYIVHDIGFRKDIY